MSLNANDQLHLLYDLLSEQSEDCCGSVSECQQIKRLVQSLISKDSVNNQELQQLLPEIYNYGRQGEMAQNLDEHISTNQQNLKNWVHVIDYTTE